MLHSALLHTALLQVASRACLQVGRGLVCTEASLRPVQGSRVGTGACLHPAMRCVGMEMWCEMSLCCCGVCVVLVGEARLARASMAGAAGEDGTVRLAVGGRQLQLKVVRHKA